ncbi:MAG: hypothetical protein LBR95_00320 [Azoarcus sp.]|jgi:hypothetical protein|nr:hypothetical protein [Azoarcus sp.]
MIVIDMEDGSIVRDAAATGPQTHAACQPVDVSQPQLQKVSLPPKAVCPPPPLNIDAFFVTLDA